MKCVAAEAPARLLQERVRVAKESSAFCRNGFLIRVSAFNLRRERHFFGGDSTFLFDVVRQKRDNWPHEFKTLVHVGVRGGVDCLGNHAVPGQPRPRRRAGGCA